MKKSWLQISASLMALVVLFVSIGWDVKFHYCTVDHELTGSFSDASANCVHCTGHHHDHEMAPTHPSDVAQFNPKCCCDDFDQFIRFTDNYVFSSGKHLDHQLQPSIIIHIDLQELTSELRQTLRHFTTSNIPNHLPIGNCSPKNASMISAVNTGRTLLKAFACVTPIRRTV